MKLLKNQAVAWGLTVVMIVAAIGIGYARAPKAPLPEPSNAPGASDSYVWDDAGVLSGSTRRALNERNDRLLREHNAVIGVVTCNYGKDDLADYAWEQVEQMGLSGQDMFIILDVKGGTYGLIQGSDIVRDFTDQDCADYLADYLEVPFSKGDYDSAVLRLTEALEYWYNN